MFMRVDVLKRTGGFDERFSAYCQAGRRLLDSIRCAYRFFSLVFILLSGREAGGWWSGYFQTRADWSFWTSVLYLQVPEHAAGCGEVWSGLVCGWRGSPTDQNRKVPSRAPLDELPQLWNVFIGDMAFIGPRSERKFYIDRIMEQDSRYRFLYQIRPGVTSYATLYNGYTDTMEKMLRRLRYDLFYLEHRSLLFDFKILVKTFLNIAFGKKF